MVGLVCLGGLRQLPRRGGRVFTIIFDMDVQQPVFDEHAQRDDALFFVFIFLDAFDGVVDGVAEQRADVAVAQPRQPVAVRHDRKSDLFALADEALFGQHAVERAVARLGERFVDEDLVGHLFDALVAQL